ncbi:MAG: hypothetical protein Q8P47_00885 [Candidatus Beckwithbacteria bacterium]|nr:hypothetical protein [Candidatus Beckwithbacteria bacterium]
MTESLLNLTPTTENFTPQYEMDIFRTVVLGGKAYLRLLNRERRDPIGMFESFARAVSEGRAWPELWQYPLEGLGFVEALKRSDRAANNFTDGFYHRFSSGKLAKKHMENPFKPDHGWPHIRRNEEWLEAMMLRDTAVRHERELPYKFWLPSLYLANRWHDVFQQINGKKDWHPELATLFILAAHNLVGQSFGVDQAEGWHYAKGAALIILPHSHPEILSDGLAQLPSNSPANILEQLGSSFYRLMPQSFRRDFNQEFLELRRDKRELTNGLSNEDLIVLRKLSRILGLADKAESIFPAKFATLRTFLSSKSRERPFYQLVNLRMSFDDEVKLLLADGSKGKSRSDVHRKIFELLRPLPLIGNSWMEKIMRRNTLAGIVGAKNIFLSLLQGNQAVIEAIFKEREESIIKKVARRQRDSGQSLRLKQQLESLGQEKERLMNALGGKIMVYQLIDRQRTEALFDLVLARALYAQERPGTFPIPEEWLPYKYFDSISSSEEMQKGVLR